MGFTAAVPGNQFRHLAMLYHGRSEYPSVSAPSFSPARHAVTRFLSRSPRRKAQLVRQELGDDPAHMTLADMAELGLNPARIIPAVLSYASQHRGQNRLLYRGADLARPHGPRRYKRQPGMRRSSTWPSATARLLFLCPYDGVQASGVGPGRCGLHAPGRHQGRPGDSERQLPKAAGPSAAMQQRAVPAADPRRGARLPRRPAPGSQLRRQPGQACWAHSHCASPTWYSPSASLPPTPCATPAAAERCSSR